ncbi:hypothetical protein EST38_g10076 [Candolleomyces aberdarensis]|uniref:DUF6593 domain-containing protein n=1 Tax=Candolleomyces aberdarensis TaxID=2316362 RepID=A0A4Q2DBK5_9AGAR|nr:hypothetical protein EST38_g10076 [Candolleomyces aberdarensis]
MTGADCAISHDDDWMQHAVTESSWTDEAYLDIVSSRTITVVNGVAHFLPKSGVRSLQIIASSPVGNDAGHKVLADNPKQLDLGIGNSVARPLATPEGPAARSSHCTYDIFFTGRDDPRGCIVIGEETEPVYFCFETAEKALPRARTIVYAGNQNYVAKLDWSPGNHLGSATIGSRQIPMLQMVLPGTSPQARAFNCLDGRRYEWRRLRDNPTSYDLYSLTGVPSRIAVFRRYAQATVVGPSHAMVQYTFDNRELLIEALLALCINRCMDLLSVSAADLTTTEDVSI